MDNFNAPIHHDSTIFLLSIILILFFVWSKNPSLQRNVHLLQTIRAFFGFNRYFCALNQCSWLQRISFSQSLLSTLFPPMLDLWLTSISIINLKMKFYSIDSLSNLFSFSVFIGLSLALYRFQMEFLWVNKLYRPVKKDFFSFINEMWLCCVVFDAIPFSFWLKETFS